MNNQKSIFVHTETSGLNTEGIGAVAQDQLGCYAFSKMHNCKFYFKGFEKIHHYQYFDVTQEKFCKDFDLLFNNFNSEKIQIDDYKKISYTSIDSNFIELTNKKEKLNQNYLIHFNTGTVFKYMEKNFDLLDKQDVFEDLKNNLFIPEELKYYNNNNINIAFHIRKFTQTDCDPAAYREYFSLNKKEQYVSLIKEIAKSLEQFSNKKEFHIYSQGEENDFSFLKEIVLPLDCKIILHIEEYPSVSLYHMIKSDVLIMANSSFSFISHVLGNQVTFVRKTFYYNTYNSKKIILNEQNKFNKKQFESLIKEWLIKNNKL